MQETQEMQVWSLGQEDSPEKQMATQSIILAWKIPWTEEPGGLQSKISQRLGHFWATNHMHMASNKAQVSFGAFEAQGPCMC